MRVRDLGTLVVAVDDDEQPVVGSRGTALLALLTINVNQRVSVDALMDAAWGSRVTAGSASTLESHIWRLRQLLEPHRAPRQPATMLLNDAGGYRLIGGSSSVDSLAFAAAVGEVGDLLAANDAAQAVRRAETAMALWRGQPYGVFADEEWARPAVARLQELHYRLQELRIEALLASGAMDLALSDLQPLIAGQPFREHLRALQMEALYRSGRGEQSLQAYQDVRRALLDEVGIEPGIELQYLHRKILDNDPSLTRPARSAPMTARVGAMEVRLPPALTPLIGRQDVLTRLAELVREQRLVTVAGPAGCGKTRLAVEVARAAAPDFSDGVWFVDLTTVSDPELVIDVVSSTIGIAVAAGATPGETLRSYLRARRVLLVLDNCEHVLTAVTQLVHLTLGDPDVAAECCLLTTSREPISVDGEIVWTLTPLGLPGDGDDPAAAPAVELFLQRLRAVRPALLIDDQVMERVVAICAAVDGLPLPLELAAARAPSFTLDDIVAQVTADPSRLGRIGRGPADHRATVRSAIEWGHRLLTPALQIAHRRISVLPGRFTPELAAQVICGSGVELTVDPAGRPAVDRDDVDDLLAQLTHRSMLAPAGLPGRPTAFRQLATMRSHAQHMLVETGETALCLDRRDDWTTAHLKVRPPLGSSAEVEWYGIIDDVYPSVRATLARALIEEPDARRGRLASRLSYYWYYREMMVEGTRWLRLDVDMLRGVDRVELLVSEIALAASLAAQGRVDLARPLIDEALDALPTTTTEQLVAIGEALVGLIVALWWRDQHHQVIQAHELLDRVVDRTGSAELGLLADAVGCEVLFVQGHIDESVSRAWEVHERACTTGNLMARWVVCGPPVVTALLAGKPDDGIPWVHRCMQDHFRLGTGAAGMFIETRADFAAMQGDYLRAAELYAAARVETRRAGMPWPRRTLTGELMTTTQDYLSRADYERAWRDGEQLTIPEIAAAG